MHTTRRQLTRTLVNGPREPYISISRFNLCTGALEETILFIVLVGFGVLILHSIRPKVGIATENTGMIWNNGFMQRLTNLQKGLS